MRVVASMMWLTRAVTSVTSTGTVVVEEICRCTSWLFAPSLQHEIVGVCIVRSHTIGDFGSIYCCGKECGKQ